MSNIVLKTVVVPPIVIDLGDREALEKPARLARELAESMVIDSEAMALEAAKEMADCAGKAKLIEDWRLGITRPIDSAKAHVIDFARKAVGDFTAAHEALRAKVGAWHWAERERIERERQERERFMREQREKAEAEAREQARLAREAEERAAAAARAAQEAQNQEARAQLEREAAAAALEAEQHRDEAATQAAISQVIVAAPVAPPAKVSGLRFGERADIEVTDLVALVRYCADHPEYVHLLIADKAAIKALYKAQKDRFAIPGVQVTKEIAAGRTGKTATA